MATTTKTRRRLPRTGATVDRLPFTGDDEADRLLVEEPMALLIGFELDQQVPLQKAFSGPLELKRRIGTLDAATIAGDGPRSPRRGVPPATGTPPVPREHGAAHAGPRQVIAADYGNDARRVWSDAKDGKDLERRLNALPGFGDMKVQTMIAILGKQLGVRPPGWEEVAPTHMTLGDVDGPEALKRYQDGKRAYKAAMREAQAAEKA